MVILLKHHLDIQHGGESQHVHHGNRFLRRVSGYHLYQTWGAETHVKPECAIEVDMVEVGCTLAAHARQAPRPETRMKTSRTHPHTNPEMRMPRQETQPGTLLRIEARQPAADFVVASHATNSIMKILGLKMNAADNMWSRYHEAERRTN